MILSYTLPGAEEKIISEQKIHSIRKDKTGRWIPGRTIDHATGVRSKNYKCFRVDICSGVQTILLVVDCKDELMITVDRKRLTTAGKLILANNDGFKTIEEMKDWFFPISKLRNNKLIRKQTMFSGKIIHWTDTRY